MIDLNPYICFSYDYRTEDLSIPSWTSSSFTPDPKKLEKEQKEYKEAIQYQIKKGILQMKKQVKPTEIKNEGGIGKIHVTPCIVTKLKGIDLFQECFCGSGKVLRECHMNEALARVK